MLMVGMVLGVMPAVCLLYLWAASPGHMPTCPPELPSFLLRRLLSHGIHLGGRRLEWQQGVKLDKAFRKCSLCLLVCLLGHVPRSYCAGLFMVGLP